MPPALVAATSVGTAAVAATTPAIDTTGASLLIVHFAKYPTLNANEPFTDSKGNTWTGLTKQTGGTGGSAAASRLFYCWNPTVGSGHTVNSSGGDQYARVSFLAYSGIDTGSDPLIAENGAVTSGATSLSPGSVSPSGSDLFVTGVCTFDPSSGHTVGSSFALDKQDNAASGTNLGSGVGSKVSGSAENPAWTWVTSGPAAATIAVFRAAGGGGGASVTPGTASLTLTRFAPTVATPRVVTPGVASLTTTGFAPSVATPRSVTPGTLALTLTGFAPTVTGGQGLTLIPGTGSLSLAGFTPTVSTPRSVTPGTGSLTVAGFAPTVSTPRAVTPGTASLTLTAFAPTVSAGGSVNVTPGTRALTVTFYAPTVSAGGAANPYTFAWDGSTATGTAAWDGASLPPNAWTGVIP